MPKEEYLMKAIGAKKGIPHEGDSGPRRNTS